MPREHGSWSLALEPIALGLLLAPSVAGGCLAGATFAAFLARRPLKTVLDNSIPTARRHLARRALLGLGGLSGVLATLAYCFAEGRFILWLLPAVVLGAMFLWFDLRKAGREQAAEIFGSAAFAMITGAIVAASGRRSSAILVASFLMLARAVPTVLFVRAIVRGNKTGAFHPAAMLVSAIGAAAIATLLAVRDMMPILTVAPVLLLLTRAILFLGENRKLLRARTLGLQELIVGVLYVTTVAATWRP
jgi:hypothetical protein